MKPTLYPDFLILLLYNRLLYNRSVVYFKFTVQRSAKILVRGLVKFVPAIAYLAGTNFTKPRTKTLADKYSAVSSRVGSGRGACPIYLSKSILWLLDEMPNPDTSLSWLVVRVHATLPIHNST